MTTATQQTDEQLREEAYAHRNFYGRGEFRYAVTPPSWNTKKYGKPPVLGFVHADNEFLAERLSYDLKIVGAQTVRPGLKLIGEVRTYVAAKISQTIQ